jgi:hypothetical protein
LTIKKLSQVPTPVISGIVHTAKTTIHTFKLLYIYDFRIVEEKTIRGEGGKNLDGNLRHNKQFIHNITAGYRRIPL